MSSDHRSRHSAAAVLARARELAASRTEPIDPDAEALMALASGSATASDVDDETLERLVQRFGADAIVQAMRGAPAGRRLGNAVDGWSHATAAPPASARVMEMPPRRVTSWRQPSWLAAAASFGALAVAAALLAGRWGPEPAAEPPAGIAQPGGTVPRSQPATPAGATPTTPPAVGTLNRLAVLLRSDDSEAASAAEAAMLRSVSARTALPSLSAEGLAALRRAEEARQPAEVGSFGPLANEGRVLGVDALVVGTLRVTTREGDGYTSVAEIRLHAHRVSTQRTGEEQTFVSSPMPSAPTARDARLRAAQDAADKAAGVVATWLQRAR